MGKPRRRKVEDTKKDLGDVYDVAATGKTLVFNGVPCVYIEKGVTKNMGEFNSARVTIGMTLPIDYTEEDLLKANKALDVIDAIVVDRLEQEVIALLED